MVPAPRSGVTGPVAWQSTGFVESQIPGQGVDPRKGLSDIGRCEGCSKRLASHQQLVQLAAAAIEVVDDRAHFLKPAPRAAVIDTALEDVGVDTATDPGLAGRLGVPGVVFPGRPVAGAVVLIIAGIEVDVAEGGTLFKAEGHWGPLEVAVGEDLGVGFLPGEGYSG